MPDWLLERLALGELDAETAADVRRRLAAEGRSPDDIMAAVAASNREILAELLRHADRGGDPQRAAKAAAAAARAAGHFMMGVLRARRRPRADAADGRPAHRRGRRVARRREPRNHREGQPGSALYVYRRSAGGNQRLRDGASARGDLVQLAYGGAGYGVVLSIDGAGASVTLHWPEKNAATPGGEGRAKPPALVVRAGRRARLRTLLPGAAPRQPFSVATAAESRPRSRGPAVGAQQALALPPGFEQISLSLDKTHAAKKELP